MTTIEPVGTVSPAAELLGRRHPHPDGDAGRVRIAFSGSESFRNRAGTVHGGLLAAMLDEVITATIVAATGGTSLAITIAINVQILCPAPVGPLVGEGTITLMGRNISFAEAKLLVAESPVARATGCCRLVPIEHA